MGANAAPYAALTPDERDRLVAALAPISAVLAEAGSA